MHLLVPLFAFAILALAFDYDIDGFGLSCLESERQGSDGTRFKFFANMNVSHCEEHISVMRNFDKKDGIIRFASNLEGDKGYGLPEDLVWDSCNITLAFTVPPGEQEDHFSFGQLSHLLGRLIDRCLLAKDSPKLGGYIQFGLEKKMLAIIQPTKVRYHQSFIRPPPLNSLPPKAPPPPPTLLSYTNGLRNGHQKVVSKPRSPR